MISTGSIDGSGSIDGRGSIDGGRRPKVVLVGPMGAGKSTVARRLGEHWGIEVRDTDQDIEKSAGKPVSEIFVDDGEEHFRTLEVTAVADALATHDGVLALGGGAVLAPATRQALQGHTVVYLEVGLADAVKRVGLGHGRPLLLGNVRSRVAKLLEERAPIYAAVATLTVDTNGRTPDDVAAEIIRRVEENA